MQGRDRQSQWKKHAPKGKRTEAETKKKDKLNVKPLEERKRKAKVKASPKEKKHEGSTKAKPSPKEKKAEGPEKAKDTLKKDQAKGPENARSLPSGEEGCGPREKGAQEESAVGQQGGPGEVQRAPGLQALNTFSGKVFPSRCPGAFLSRIPLCILYISSPQLYFPLFLILSRLFCIPSGMVCANKQYGNQ